MIKSLLAGCKQIGMRFSQFGKSYKLLSEEIQIFTFLKTYSKICEEFDQYFEMMMGLMSYRADGGHSEAIIRLVILNLNNLVISGKKLDLEVYMKKMRELVQMRYRWGVSKNLSSEFVSFVAE